MMLAAAPSKLGRMDEARPPVERVLQLHPTSAVADDASLSALFPALATPLIEAMRAAGLPD
jgi:hypothetical protein